MTRRSHTRLYRAAALTVSMMYLTSCAADAPAAEDVAPISAPTTIYGGSYTSLPAEEVLGGNTFTSPEDADRSDVDSTARVAALMLHSWDTTVDRTETAAAVRAAPESPTFWTSWTSYFVFSFFPRIALILQGMSSSSHEEVLESTGKSQHLAT